MAVELKFDVYQGDRRAAREMDLDFALTMARGLLLKRATNEVKIVKLDPQQSSKDKGFNTYIHLPLNKTGGVKVKHYHKAYDHIIFENRDDISNALKGLMEECQGIAGGIITKARFNYVFNVPFTDEDKTVGWDERGIALAKIKRCEENGQIGWSVQMPKPRPISSEDADKAFINAFENVMNKPEELTVDSEITKEEMIKSELQPTSYGIIFPTKQKAEEVFESLKVGLKENGYISRNAYVKAFDGTLPDKEPYYGWRSLDNAEIYEVEGGYSINLPKTTFIEELQ